MSSYVSHTTVDCANAYEPGHRILVIEVPEPKSVKNRIRAREVSDHRGQYGPGSGWVVLADPEGNEFCILRSDG